MAAKGKVNLSLKLQGLIMIVLLGIQYLLGIITNLYVTFPDTTNKGILWEFAWRQTSIALHIILGIGLLVGSIIIVINAIKSKAKEWYIPSRLAFISILLAGASGASFIEKQKDIYSLTMAIFFIVAVSSYIWGIYKSSN